MREHLVVSQLICGLVLQSFANEERDVDLQVERSVIEPNLLRPLADIPVEGHLLLPSE